MSVQYRSMAAFVATSYLLALPLAVPVAWILARCDEAFHGRVAAGTFLFALLLAVPVMAIRAGEVIAPRRALPAARARR